MAGELQPLDLQFPIVDAQGRPTQYFIRWAQQRQIDIGDSATETDLLEGLAKKANLNGGNTFTGNQNFHSGYINTVGLNIVTADPTGATYPFFGFFAVDGGTATATIFGGTLADPTMYIDTEAFVLEDLAEANKFITADKTTVKLKTHNANRLVATDAGVDITGALTVNGVPVSGGGIPEYTTSSIIASTVSNASSVYVPSGATVPSALPANAGNLSVTFTIAALSKVEIEFQGILNKSAGTIRLYVADNAGTRVWPASLAGDLSNWSIGSRQSVAGFNGQQILGKGVVSLAAGTYTLVVWYDHVSAVGNVIWYDRELKVRILP
jgi:hypothetical protein